VRDRGGFDPVAGVQLLKDMRDVDAGGLDADHQRRRDLAVGGAAAAMVERQGNAWPPDEAPHFQRSRAAAGALDPDRFERAWAAGRRMPPARAVSFALAPRREAAAMLR
jgi:hypothetical protein